MRVRIVNVSSESVSIPIVPAQAQLEAILEAAGWLKVERLHTGQVYSQTLTPNEQASYPVDRFTHDQLEAVDRMQEAGKIKYFVEG